MFDFGPQEGAIPLRLTKSQLRQIERMAGPRVASVVRSQLPKRTATRVLGGLLIGSYGAGLLLQALQLAQELRNYGQRSSYARMPLPGAQLVAQNITRNFQLDWGPGIGISPDGNGYVHNNPSDFHRGYTEILPQVWQASFGTYEAHILPGLWRYNSDELWKWTTTTQPQGLPWRLAPVSQQHRIGTRVSVQTQLDQMLVSPVRTLALAEYMLQGHPDTLPMQPAPQLLRNVTFREARAVQRQRQAAAQRIRVGTVTVDPFHAPYRAAAERVSLGVPMPDFELQLAGSGNGRTRPRQPTAPHTRTPPRRNTKERKTKMQKKVFGILSYALWMTEALDLLDVLYENLPAHRKSKHAKRPQQKAQLVYKYWDEIDVPYALISIMFNQIEDSAVGRTLGKLDAYGVQGGVNKAAWTESNMPELGKVKRLDGTTEWSPFGALEDLEIATEGLYDKYIRPLPSSVRLF